MNLARINLFFERLWLVIGVVGMVYGLYQWSVLGFEGAKMYLLYPMIAFALFGMRYRLRKRLERNPPNTP
jgi:hypothetical protein